MKPFDLNLAKQGKPVCTAAGHPARIICFDRKGSNYPIVALVDDVGYDRIYEFTDKGRFWSSNPDDVNEKTSDRDLMMVSEKKEGYINIYRRYSDDPEYPASITEKDTVYNTREEAEKAASLFNGYIATAHITWEE